VLAVRQIVQEHEEDERVQPPPEGDVRVRRLGGYPRVEHVADSGRDGHGGRHLAGGDLHAVQVEVGDHEARDHAKDEVCVCRDGLGIGRCHDPPDAGHDDADQREERDEVEEEVERVMDRCGQRHEGDGTVQALQDEFPVGKQQDHERPEQDEVVETEGLLQYPFLGKGVDEGVSNPGWEVFKTVFRLADGDEAEAAHAAPYEQEDCGYKHYRENFRIRYHENILFLRILSSNRPWVSLWWPSPV